MFKQLDFLAKVNLDFGFVLKSFEDGAFSYFYAPELLTVLEGSKGVCIPIEKGILKRNCRKKILFIKDKENDRKMNGIYRKLQK